MPTIQEQRQTIREACIAANDDILKLQFGCRVYINEELNPYQSTIIDAWGIPSKRYFYLLGEPHKIYTEEMLTLQVGNKILGRDIRLADVLLAIEKNSNQSIVFDTKGRITDIRTATSNGFHGAINWNLLHDSLDLQSDELIEFVYPIIYKN